MDFIFQYALCIIGPLCYVNTHVSGKQGEEFLLTCWDYNVGSSDFQSWHVFASGYKKHSIELQDTASIWAHWTCIQGPVVEGGVTILMDIIDPDQQEVIGYLHTK